MGNFGKCIIQDCMAGLKSIPDNSIELCITDPPYGIKYNSNHYKNGNPNPIITNDEHFFVEWIPEVYRILKDNAGIFVFTSHKVYETWKVELSKYFTYKNMIVWVKDNWSMGDLEGNFGEQFEIMIYAVKGNYKIKGKRLPNVVYANRIPPHTYNHQTPKPVECIIPYIQSLNPENIIDPFAGTCFVGQAAEILGISWLTFEMDLSYLNSIQFRIKEGMKKRKTIKEQKTLTGQPIDIIKIKERRKQKKFGSISSKKKIDHLKQSSLL